MKKLSILMLATALVGVGCSKKPQAEPTPPVVTPNNPPAPAPAPEPPQEEPAPQMLEEPAEPATDPQVAWEVVESQDYELSADAQTLLKWKKKTIQYIDMTADERLSKVVHIGDNAFREVNQLKAIKLPRSLRSIGESAFMLCGALEYINFPPQVERIARAAFAYTSLERVRVTAPIHTVGENAFWTCPRLTHISFSKTVNKIEHSALKACTALEELKLWAHQVVPYPKDLLYGASKVSSIYVQPALVDAYKKAEGWQAHAAKIKPISLD